MNRRNLLFALAAPGIPFLALESGNLSFGHSKTTLKCNPEKKGRVFIEGTVIDQEVFNKLALETHEIVLSNCMICKDL